MKQSRLRSLGLCDQGPGTGLVESHNDWLVICLKGKGTGGQTPISVRAEGFGK